MLHRAIETLHRREGARILAGLIRRLGSFDIAEEALQEAYAKALHQWTRDGLPDNPAAWLATVARNKGIDILRREAKTVGDSEAILAELTAEADESEDEFGMPDDHLRLIFTCCHPSLSQSGQAALALRTLCQLTTGEIARAFVEPETTTAQKIVRAKRKISAARIPYVIPQPSELPDRMAAVLAVVYLVFNEGYSATAHERLIRPDLVNEAIRLGRMLTTLMPDEPEALGLLALMLLHHARTPAREAEDGTLIPLEEQDRVLWHQAQILEGLAILDSAMLARRPGPYQLQAAIAALHSSAKSAPETDWAQISALYGALLRHLNTPVVELNAAVAMALAGRLPEGLAWIEQIEDSKALHDYHLLHAAKADLLRRRGDAAAAIGSYRKAFTLTRNAGELKFIRRRLGELGAKN